MRKKLILIVFMLMITTNNVFTQIRNSYYQEPGFKHIAGLLLGANSFFEDSETGFKLGFNYELTNTEWNYGFGINTEFNFGNSFEFLIGIPFYYHDVIIKNLNFNFNPGITFTKNIEYYYGISGIDSSDINDNDLVLENNKFRGNFFLRLGASYDFSIYGDNKPWLFFSPTINFDILNYDKLYLIYGINITVVLDKYILKK